MQNIDQSTLAILWLFSAVGIFLAWAGILGQLLLKPERRGVRAALALLGVAGLVHPAAAAGTLDLVRMGRQLDDPDLPLGPWAMGAAALLPITSLAATVALWLQAGGN